MTASRVLLLVAVFSSIACGGKILGETAPSDADGPNEPPVPTPQTQTFADPFHPGQSWIGNYTCEQGNTDLDLKIVAMHDDVIDDAVFVFDWKAGDTTGSFHLSGTFDATSGNATFAPADWINQPSSNGTAWVSVGMTGLANESDFSGSITNGSCGAFTVQKS